MPKLLPSIAEDQYEVGAHMAAGTQREHSSVDTFMKNIEVVSADIISSHANIELRSGEISSTPARIEITSSNVPKTPVVNNAMLYPPAPADNDEVFRQQGRNTACVKFDSDEIQDEQEEEDFRGSQTSVVDMQNSKSEDSQISN